MNAYRVTVRDRTTGFDIVHTVHLASSVLEAKRLAKEALSRSLQVDVENFDARKAVPL